MNVELDSEQAENCSEFELTEEWEEVKRTHIQVTVKQFLRYSKWTYSKFNREAKAGRLAVYRGNGHPKIRVEEVSRVLDDQQKTIKAEEEGDAA